MKLIESDGKKLLRDVGIIVPRGQLFAVDGDLRLFLATATFPLYLKSQVLQGRRGERGWIRRCTSPEELTKYLSELEGELRDVPHSDFLCETEILHDREWLVSLSIDRTSGQIMAGVSEKGGMSVASVDGYSIASTADIRTLALYEPVKDVLLKLFEAFVKNDALFFEINPLAILADDSCVALDAKVELDDAAAFRHPEWSAFRRLEIPVQLDGDIAVILSGGGASLVALDALKRAGGCAANYVEMSGNPDPESVHAAAKFVLSKPGIRALWIAGSHANFTDIQATVNAVLAAADELNLRIPIVIRRDGPNADAAQVDATRWAVERGVSLRFDRADVDLDTSARAVVAMANV